MEQKGDKYTVKLVSAALKYNWDRVQEGTVVKRAKPKTTRSAFTTQETTTGEEADKPAAAEASKPSKKSNQKSKKKVNEKRKRASENLSAGSGSNVAAAATTTSSGSSLNPSKKTKQYYCTACGGDRHTYDWCYFVLGEDRDKDWLDRGTFDNNIKVPSFKKKVESYRSALKTVAEAKTKAKTD